MLLNNWHKAAANSNLESYIGFMDTDGVYIGTDANENWTTKEFEIFCKPYFDKGTTWDFKPLERNIFISSENKAAWFDELLKTQMGICRGSGTLININEVWKIKHYVLSMTIPNDVSKVITFAKQKNDSVILATYE